MSDKSRNNKPIWIFFLILFLTIAICGGIVWYNIYNKSDRSGSLNESSTNDIANGVKTTSLMSDENENQTPTKLPSDTWNAETAYNGGASVIYQGMNFTAKWWTQGDVPDVNNPDGPWRYESDVQGTPVYPDEETTLPEVGEAVVGDSGFKVVGYYPSWEPDKIDRVRFDVLTHINYAFAIPTADGGLRPLENDQTAKKLIQLGHKYDVKVLLAVGGWSYNDIPLEPTFVEATSSDEKIQHFSDSIIDMMNQYGFDGIDMDWEHPRVDGDSSIRYTKLMTTLNQKLRAQNKLLTSAVLSGVTADGNVYYDSAAHKDEVLSCVDWINVMAYDGGDGDRHSSYDFAVNCVNYWKNTRKLPPEKVVLGVPFYARPSWASYSDILKEDSSADSKDIATYQGMEAHYNGIATIQKKTKFAFDNAGGIMIWEITQDTNEDGKSLLKAIGNTISENR